MDWITLSNGKKVALGACAMCGERESVELLDWHSDQWETNPQDEGKPYCIRHHPAKGWFAHPQLFQYAASQTLMQDYERWIEDNLTRAEQRVAMRFLNSTR